MKTVFYILIMIVAGSCSSTDKGEAPNPIEEEVIEQAIPKIKPSFFSGTYIGTEASHFILNRQGEPAIINGKKIEVPAIKYNVQFKEDNHVLVTLSDGKNNILHEGIINKTPDDSIFEMKLVEVTDRKYPTTPKFILRKSDDNSMIRCKGKNSPEFELLLK